MNLGSHPFKDEDIEEAEAPQDALEAVDEVDEKELGDASAKYCPVGAS